MRSLFSVLHLPMILLAVSIQTTYAQANDNVINATDISGLINSCSLDAAFTNVAATPDGIAPSCWNTSPDRNVWFKFQATTTQINITVKRGGVLGTIRRINAALWASNTTTLLSCNSYIGDNDDVVVDGVGLTVGQWYYISVDNNHAPYAGTFSLCVNDQASYDYFEGATDIGGLMNSCAPDASFTTYGATADKSAATTWNTSPNYNRWFKFQATTTQVNITAKQGSSGTIRRINLALWGNDGVSELASNRYVNDNDSVTVGYVGLTIGQWYYISVDNNYSNYRGSFTLCISNAVDYDYFEGAIDISSSINGCTPLAAYSTLGATADKGTASTWDTSPNYNRWFKFQATTKAINITAKRGGSFGDIRRINLALWGNDGVTELSSNRYVNDNDSVVVGNTQLTIGQWYYISIDNNYSNYRGTFTLCLNDAVDYNYFEGAIDITSSINGCTPLAAYTTLGATADKSAASTWNTSPNYNRWFKFQAATTAINVTAKRGGTYGDIRRINLALWENDGTTELASNRYINDNDSVVVGYNLLTPGKWYYVSIDNNYSNYRGTFTLCLDDAVDYDYFEGAIDITGLIDNCSANAAYTTMGATSDKIAASTWNTSPNYNRWFKFKATSFVMNVHVLRGGALGDIRRINAAIWQEDGETEVASKRYINDNDDVTVGTLDLVPGNWYYLSIDNNYSNYRGTFSLCLDTQLDYDFYEGAQLITNLDNWTSANEAYSTLGATADLNPGSTWNTSPNYNRWFKFKATTNQISITVLRGGVYGTIRRINLALWGADGVTELVSNRYVNDDDDVSISATNLTPGNWYYFSVDNNYSNYRGTFTLRVSSSPDYDFYEGAIEITDINNWCSADAAYTTIGATRDRAAASCWNTSPDYNRWFKFQATTDGIQITGKRGGSFGTIRRLNIALWQSNGTTAVACNRYVNDNDDVTVDAKGLIPGNWYYISVDNNYSNYRGTFTLCVDNSPSYDYYEGAQLLSELDGWCSADAAYTTIGATGDKNAASCWNTSPNYNRWFKFQAIHGTVTIDIKTQGTKGTVRRLNAALWQANGTTQLACKRYVGDNDDLQIVQSGLTIGNWYYISVDNNYSNYRGTFTLCVSNVSSDQYYAIADGNWETPATWSKIEGGSPDGTFPTSAHKVTIKGYDVSVTGSVAAATLNLIVANDSTSLSVAGSGAMLKVSGNLNFSNPGNNFGGTLTTSNLGRLNVGNKLTVTRSGGANMFRIDVQSNSHVYVANDFSWQSIAGTVVENELLVRDSLEIGQDLLLDYDAGMKIGVRLNGSGVLRVARDIYLDTNSENKVEIELNNTSTLSLGRKVVRNATPYGRVTGKDNSTVNYSSSKYLNTIAKNAGAGTDVIVYQNLTFNNTRVSSPQLTLEGKVKVLGTLTMMSGNLDAGIDTLELGTSSASRGTLVHTLGTIIGNYKKWINAASQTSYYFPVGTNLDFRPITINFNDIPTGAIVARFTSTPPGNNGLPLVDGANTYYQTFTEGYWKINPQGGLSSTNYNTTVVATSFDDYTITAATRLLVRASSASNWTTNGTAVATTGITLARQNISILGAEFGVADNTCIENTSSITGNSQLREYTQNETYFVTNKSGYSYAWTITGGTLTSGQGTNIITVNWGVAGPGKVEVVAAYNGCNAPVVELNTTLYQTIVSNGLGGGNWNNPASWEIGVVPGTIHDVVIKSSDVITLNIDTAIYSLTVEGTLNQNGSKLTVAGNYVVNGMHHSTGNDKLYLSGVNTLISGTGTLDLGGRFWISTGNKLIPNTANLAVSTGNWYIGPNRKVFNNGSITLVGELQGGSTTSTWENRAGSTLIAGGSGSNAILNTGILVAYFNGNTIRYNLSGSQNIKVPYDKKYYHLILQSTNSALLGEIKVMGNLTTSGTFNPSGYGFTLEGNWTNSGSYIKGTTVVTFSGTRPQTLSESLYGLKINKNLYKVTLANHVTISNQVDLTKGLLKLGSYNLFLNNTASAAILNGSGSSYIEADGTGTVNWAAAIGNSMRFPVGDNSNYSPLTFTLTSGSLATPYVTLRLKDEVHPEVYGADYLSRYWILGSSGISAANFNLSYTYRQVDVVGDESKLFGTLYTTDWESGGVVNTGTNVITWTGLTMFGDFSGGDDDAILPIELISFEVESDPQGAKFTWVTATELNNDFFTVERSLDLENFEVILTQAGAGTTKEKSTYTAYDFHPLSGVSYYRLKQTDFDGAFAYSDVIVFFNQNDETPEITVFPNPFNGQSFTIRINHLENTPLVVSVYNLGGQVIFQKDIRTSFQNESIPVIFERELTKGIYVLSIETIADRYTYQLIYR